MKIFRIFFVCFTILFFVAWWYIDEHLKLHSVYWLAAKLLCFVIILFGLIYSFLKNAENSKFSLVFGCCFWTLWTSYYSYKEIKKYQYQKCDDRFGREFNEHRRTLGTPEIPSDWYTDREWHRSVTWKAKNTMGHISKDIDVDSTCTIMSEYDEYHLKPVKGKARSISIETRYKLKKGKDSITYWYEPGIDTNRYITRQQADSIFAAEKIKKDY